MERNCATYRNYITILQEEMIPATGCTEPIAIAYAAAKCRDLLGEQPLRSKLIVSGPIIKNVKSVVVPNTGNLRGLQAAVAAGIVGGNAEALLQVLAGITEERQAQIKQYLAMRTIQVVPADNNRPFYIELILYGNEHTARVVIEEYHTNLVLLERDGEMIAQQKARVTGIYLTDHSILNTKDIYDFANTVDLNDIRGLIDRQIAYNSAIASKGLSNAWGAQVGKTLLKMYGNNDIRICARAAAAAGSDARMSGCEMPVVILSGSGNQGMATSLPVIEFSKSLGSSEEKLYRALVLASLLTIHQKSGIGRVSAFCGAVSAGVSAGCGIAYLYGADLETIEHTIINALGICPGMVCDGAKPSCAAKVSAAVDAGIMGYMMYSNGQSFHGGDGILKNNTETTIKAVSEMAREGMRDTDKKILQIMLRD
jgi:L-cysteine desulfidase